MDFSFVKKRLIYNIAQIASLNNQNITIKQSKSKISKRLLTSAQHVTADLTNLSLASLRFRERQIRG